MAMYNYNLELTLLRPRLTTFTARLASTDSWTLLPQPVKPVVTYFYFCHVSSGFRIALCGLHIIPSTAIASR